MNGGITGMWLQCSLHDKKPTHDQVNLFLYLNRPYLYSRYWTGTSLQLRLMRGVLSNTNIIFFFVMILPQIRECGRGLFSLLFFLGVSLKQDNADVVFVVDLSFVPRKKT